MINALKVDDSTFCGNHLDINFNYDDNLWNTLEDFGLESRIPITIKEANPEKV